MRHTRANPPLPKRDNSVFPLQNLCIQQRLALQGFGRGGLVFSVAFLARRRLLCDKLFAEERVETTTSEETPTVGLEPTTTRLRALRSAD